MVITGNTFFIREAFDDNVVVVVEKPIIWMYWENQKGSTKRPAYLDLCEETILQNCGNDFTIRRLDERSVQQYIPVDFKQYESIWSIPQKTDYIRLFLLAKYGGIWLDADIIMIRSLIMYYQQLQNSPYDYLGFGCYFGHCSQTMNGYGGPANWVMMSKPRGTFVMKCLEQATLILTNTPELLQSDYHCLGKTLLSSVLQELFHTQPSWNYIHIRSRCVERDSYGTKLTNEILLQNRKIDQKCKRRYIFVPCYNTAPSFPDWFKAMDRNAILTMNALIGRLFVYALTK